MAANPIHAAGRRLRSVEAEPILAERRSLIVGAAADLEGRDVEFIRGQLHGSSIRTRDSYGANRKEKGRVSGPGIG